MALELRTVEDYPIATSLVRDGFDSRRLVVLRGEDTDAAISTARAGIVADRGPLPLAPYDCGKRCLVVLPTYDERDNLARMVGDILAYLSTDVLIVDDGSPDGTGLIADGLAANEPRVSVLHRESKLGLGTAYLAGFALALERGYERVFEMDADFSHPPWDLPYLAAASLDSALVIGSRYVAGGSTIGWSWRRRLLSKCANLYSRVVLGISVRDLTAGFRCYDCASLAQLDLGRVSSQGYGFQIEMAFRMARAGFSIREVPIRFSDRKVGTSKMSGQIATEALLLVPRLRFRVKRRAQ